MKESLSALKKRAIHTLEANLVETERGLFLAAGGHQFRTLWTRDFCFSVPGLLEGGWHDLVERQLTMLLSFAEFGQLPRGVDVVNPKWRVVWNTALRHFSNPLTAGYAGRLRAEHRGEHGTPAFDSNLLFLKAWVALVKAGGAVSAVAAKVPELLQPFTAFLTHGELQQPAYSDWQDSAKRSGAVLHTHLLLFEVLRELERLELLPAAFLGFDRFIPGFLEERFDPERGLFREFTEGPHQALDSHLLLLKSPAIRELSGASWPGTALFEALRASPLWGIFPGLPITPPYADSEVAFTTKLVGLRHYHDGFHWGWLAAEAAHVAFLNDDPIEGVRILELLMRTGREEEMLAEIFEEKEGRWRPVERWLYRAESPFTWTAAKCLEALSALD